MISEFNLLGLNPFAFVGHRGAKETCWGKQRTPVSTRAEIVRGKQHVGTDNRGGGFPKWASRQNHEK